MKNKTSGGWNDEWISALHTEQRQHKYLFINQLYILHVLFLRTEDKITFIWFMVRKKQKQKQNNWLNGSTNAHVPPPPPHPHTTRLEPEQEQ